MDPHSRHLEFARKWIGETWRADFRLGILVRGPGWDFHDPKRRHARKKGKEHRKTALALELEARQFHEWLRPILCGLHKGEMSIQQAKDAIVAKGYVGNVRIATTQEELINGITEFLDDGCNAWDSGGIYAWCDEGLFEVNFWYDPSHRR